MVFIYSFFILAATVLSGRSAGLGRFIGHGKFIRLVEFTREYAYFLGIVVHNEVNSELDQIAVDAM